MIAGALVARAPAKINLTLRVLGRRADGYHELESLVAFAGIADRLQLEPGAALSLTGTTAKLEGRASTEVKGGAMVSVSAALVKIN